MAAQQLNEGDKEARSAGLGSGTLDDDDAEMELAHILDVPAIQSLMDDFFGLTQIGVAIIDKKGTVLVATGWQDICTKFHRVHPETARHCLESDTLLSSEVEPGTFKIYRCKNQMWDMSTPIIIGGKHLGNLFLGQFFFADEEPDYPLFREQARKYGFDEKEYLAALDRAPRWEREKVNRVMAFYSKFARLISELSLANVGLTRIVRERDALLRSLKESEAKYRRLVEHSNDIIWEFDIASQKFTFASDAVGRILGYPIHVGRNMRLDDIFTPKGKKEILAAFGKVWNGNGDMAEDRVVVEAKHRHHDGHGVWMEISATLLRDSGGNPKGFSGVTRDISQRKRVEEEKAALEAQNRQLQKAESLGRMAGAVAHHFNNHLQAVIGNLELAMDQLPQVAGPIASLNDALKAAQRAAGVSRQMLTYLGQAPAKREALDLSEICRGCLPMLRATLPGSMALKTDLPSTTTVIHGNRNQIEQVLTNLVANALEAMPETGGLICLKVRTVSRTDIPKAQRFPVDWRPGADAYACLEVTDEGTGISEGDVDKLFDPFFSTKFTGRGLGLPVALGIIKAHGGCVTVGSREEAESRGRGAGKKDNGRQQSGVGGQQKEGLGPSASWRENPVGSLFQVFLPLSEKAVGRPVQTAAGVPDLRGRGTVLLVEDTDQVRKLGVRMLEMLGFRVIEARDGMEGVEILRERPDQIRFVVCDLTMPRMDGWKTLEALRKIKPDIPAILASGYDEASVMMGEHAEWPQVFLGKPYSLRDLGQAIGRLVDRQARA